MSHSAGRVRFSDGLILHFEYNGTADIVIPALWNTPVEVTDHWRNQPLRKCTCGNDELVEVAEAYGGGEYWPGRACRKCMCVVEGLGVGIDESLYDKEKDGLPSWWE